MKKICFSIALLFLALCSCKKEASRTSSPSDDYLRTVMTQLKDSVASGDYAALDVGTVFVTPSGGGRTNWLRIPFRGKSVASDFVLLQTDRAGTIAEGRIVHLENTGVGWRAPFNGSIRISSLGRKNLLESEITDGYIMALHLERRIAAQTLGTVAPTVLADPYVTLPEVVVVGYLSQIGDAGSNGYAMDLGSLSPAQGANGGGASGVPGNGGGGAGAVGGGGGSGSGGGGVSPYVPVNPTAPSGPRPVLIEIPAMEIETEYSNSIPVVDISKFFNCFDELVPSPGATYSITLCTDVPINSNPEAIVDVPGSTVGHSFLVVTKANAGVSVTQAFGFYPAQNPSIWNPFGTLPSDIKDNGSQEINGSISMSVTADQFASFRATAIGMSTLSYSMQNFNCTDYALDLFNTQRPGSPLTLQPLYVTPYDIPGGAAPGMPSTPTNSIEINNSPQGLYALLQSKKNNAGDPDAGNIQLDLTGKTKAAASHGECN